MRAHLHMLRRRWGMIVLAVLLGIGAAMAVTAVMPGTYQAKATVYVMATVGPGESDSAYESGLLSEQRMKSYIELAKSERIAQDVITQLHLDMTPADLASRVNASSVAGTVVLSLSATDSSPQRAAEITNAVAASLSNLIGQLERRSDNAPLVATQIVQPATPPTSPEWPDPVLNLLIGAVVGLGLGVGAMMLRRRFDTSVHSPEEVAVAAESPVLGVIAPIRRSAQPLPVLRQPTSDAAEGYRRIRTNLKYLDSGKRNRAILVTSADRGDGRTTTVCNLAIAVAQTRRRVLVIDADLRHPRVGRVLDLPDGPGLADVLIGNVDLQRALRPWGPGGFLDVLTSGALPGNPSDLLDSPSMIGLLRSMRQRYDLVLVDAPPLLQVTDAAALAPQVDGSILVVRWGQTKRERVRAAHDALQVVSANVLGAVLNRAPSSAVVYEDGDTRQHRDTEAASGREIAAPDLDMATGRYPMPAPADDRASVAPAPARPPAPSPASSGAGAAPRPAPGVAGPTVRLPAPSAPGGPRQEPNTGGRDAGTEATNPHPMPKGAGEGAAVDSESADPSPNGRARPSPRPR